MRRSLALTVLAVTSMVAVAFAIPLALLVRSAAEDRATTSAEQEARSVAGVLATVTDQDAMRGVVAQVNATSRHEVAVLLGDGTRFGTDLDVPPERAAAARDGRAFSFAHDGDHVVVVPVRTPEAGLGVVYVATDEAEMRRGVAPAWVTIGGLALVIVAIGVALAARMGRASVRSIEHLGAVTRRLRSGEMHARVDISGPPEVADVGRAVNELADQIDRLLAQEREAAADLSHRLRTPLTALQLQADSIRADDDRRRITEAVAGLTEEVSAVIAAARQRPDEARPAPADLAQVVERRMAFWRVLARQQGRPVTAATSEADLLVPVPAEELAAAVDTLLTNVFQHTPEGTSFAVTVDDVDGPRLVVEDDGPGVPHPDPERRGASAGGSTGLGLDIVRRTAQGSGGDLLVASTDGGGTRVEVTFGRAPTTAG